MSQESVEAVRRMLERWNAGDGDGWLRCWRADAEWISEPFAAFDGSPRAYRGRAQLRGFLRDVREGFADLGCIENAEFRDLRDAVLVLGVYRAKAGASGPETATPMAWLFEVRDGEIARGRDFLDQAHALEAVELRE